MANNTSYKPNEGKREEFRRYLEKTGVMDALTKALVLLYEEPDKPDDALKFILNSLARQIGSESVDDLKQQIVELQERISQLETDNRALSEGAGGGHPEGEDFKGEPLAEGGAEDALPAEAAVEEKPPVEDAPPAEVEEAAA